jgi:hypothetical protein
MNYQKMLEQMMRQQQHTNQPRPGAPHPLAGLDLNSATDLTCDNCGSMKFQVTFLLKQVSALISPTGEDVTIPIQTFSCQSCGWINKDFVQAGTEANNG